MKKIMVIAGGSYQVPLIQKIKSLGHYVINSNLYEDSPGFKYSDETYVANVLDIEKNLEIARRVRPDAILTDQSDISVPTVCKLCEELGLPTIGQSMGELFTNKFAMRNFCKEHGFLYPEYKLCKTKEEAIDFYKLVNNKMIIKPTDSQASRGVFTINCLEDLEKYFELSLNCSTKNKTVILEEFIEGTEFTVDGFKFPTGHLTLAISEKEHYEHNKNVASKLTFSYYNKNFDYDLLRKTNDSIINASGLPFGLTHVEYKYCNGQFYLIEMAARGGGGKIASHIVPTISGIDNYDLLIKASLGETLPHVKDINLEEKYKQYCAVLNFINPGKTGVFKFIAGDKEILLDKHVIDLTMNYKIGEEVFLPTDDSKRFGSYIAWGENEFIFKNVVKNIENTMEIGIGDSSEK